MLDRCSTAWAPWHVIPADRKWARNAAIAAIVRETLEDDEPAISQTRLGPESFVVRNKDHMRSAPSLVNDKMQKGYRYALTAPAGRSFDPEFKPELTPAQMLQLGVFCGKYMTDCRNEFPASWFKARKLAEGDRDCSLNYFEVDASHRCRSGSKRLALRRRPARLVPMVLPLLWAAACRRKTAARSSAGRRSAATSGRCRSNCEPGDLSCRPRQRQALLHWAYDSRKI